MPTAGEEFCKNDVEFFFNFHLRRAEWGGTGGDTNLVGGDSSGGDITLVGGGFSNFSGGGGGSPLPPPLGETLK